MLKHIPNCLSPDLLKILMEMGHGDELVIGDGNFAAAGFANRLVRCDGVGVLPILDAVLTFFPLDTFVDYPFSVMKVVGDENAKPEIWNDFERIAFEREGYDRGFEQVERFEFYERAKKAYAIVATSEEAHYACLILKKGVKPAEK